MADVVHGRWEYRLEILALSLITQKGEREERAWKDTVESLNEGGDQGWEAVAVIQPRTKVTSGSSEMEPLVLMKRPKKN